MPSERISKEFKDISLSFQVNPLNYDLIGIKNETAIARSVRNLVLTQPGERFFNQNLGSKVNRSLFENIDEISASIIKDEIENTIRNYEPRVSLIDVVVTPNFDDYEFTVTVSYFIVGVDVLPQQLSFALQPTR
ncbi:MAG: GPW/gp25 family protein [Flavobacteriaceae bacterium]|jgi:phage baseplate assembly protein W